MLQLRLPWLELSIVAPLLGAIAVAGCSQPERRRRLALIAASIALFCSAGVWLDFHSLHAFEAHDRWDLVSPWLGDDVIVVNQLSPRCCRWPRCCSS